MASTQETSTSIIKSDRAGRTRYSQAYKDEVVASYRQSGMSAAAFAAHCGVKYPTLASLVAKAKAAGSGRSGAEEDGQRFLLAEIGCSAPVLKVCDNIVPYRTGRDPDAA